MSPIDEQELRSLLQDVDPVDTGDAAQQAISRGTRRRHRRRAAAAVTAGVVAVAGIGVGSSVRHRQLEPEPATRATPARPTPSPLAAVGPGQLPTVQDLTPIATPQLPLATPQDHPAGRWGSEQVSICQPRPVLGQSSLRVREFRQANLLVAVAGFDTAEQASAARSDILGWYRGCGSTGEQTTAGDWVGERLPVPAGLVGPAGATVVEAYQGPLPQGMMRHELGVVVQAGNRLTWLVQRAEGQEGWNCSIRPDDEAVGQCGQFVVVPALARRLAG